MRMHGVLSSGACMGRVSMAVYPTARLGRIQMRMHGACISTYSCLSNRSITINAIIAHPCRVGICVLLPMPNEFVKQKQVI